MAHTWTTDDIPDLHGQVIIITGANSGLGLASAKKLAQKGATVIMACRSEERGQQALQEVEAVAKVKPQLMLLDLGDLSSVKSFADAFTKQYQRLDVLLNNAGIMATPYGTTADGFEQQIGINHLGHFALTGHLLLTLLDTPNSRIVNVSSLAARNGQVDPSSFRDPVEYKPWKAYGQSKLANLQFTKEFERRLKKHNVRVVAAHPGGASTNLGNNVETGAVMKWIANNILLPLLPSAEQNARPQLMAATAPHIQSGGYYGPGGWGEFSGAPKQVEMPDTLGTPADWEKLWAESERLTGVSYSV
jgi:NAD(P)-dependent dehydrogenase (short-subunit alcohol dehydrogenase family)